MPPRIPTEADFAELSSTMPIATHMPSPPESTTAFLVLFHGLGDYEPPFAGFAKNTNLPGVAAISVRGTAPLPAYIISSPEPRHFHWGDDLKIDPDTGDVDDDPGFERAAQLVMDKVIKGFLMEKLGWETRDIMLFGFGQGGSLALGLASRLRSAPAVVDVTEGDEALQQQKKKDTYFKGVVSIGGPLPMSMVSTSSAREKSLTAAFLLQLDEDQADAVKNEFKNVTAIRWKRKDIGMPQDMEEVLPMMKFFADRLKADLDAEEAAEP
ncbi:hypothetical protein B0I35DRAFT_432729 [Stachybotrys elegans]|uniref:Phospholipase/carboxylesterase/thioesterase domain-containing protein n=1 Tax=Stachybotrys elegans TaxID=80388 RepID=A0A8K0SRX2_9HYPO|nr:hypothetical protein B0I35DRAFT_432729 [Stachybotrys elegans]